MSKKEFTGTCTCGHSWNRHHHGCIANLQPLIDRNEEYRNVNYVLGEECEHSWLNGEQCHDFTEDNPECRCRTYEDRGWV